MKLLFTHCVQRVLKSVGFSSYLLLGCFLPGLNVSGQGHSNSVCLYGTLKNFQVQVTIEDISEMGQLEFSDPQRTFMTDSSGQFSVAFDLASANYFKIGRNTLFLSPGDSLEVFIDRDQPESAVFKGDHWRENEYLKSTPFPAAGSFLDAGNRIEPTIKATILSIFEAARSREKVLKRYEGIEIEFRKLESSRIKADIINSLVSINSYYPEIHRLSKDSLPLFRQNCEREIKPYLASAAKGLINPDLLKLKVYRDILPWLSYYKIIDKIDFFEDWMNARSLVHSIKSVKDSSIMSDFEANLKLIKSEKYRAALLRSFNRLVEFNGTKASDFIMFDRNNDSVALSSFHGKVIFIDIWAMWCPPCIEEQPYLDSLRNHYRDNKDIVFISLSIDAERQSWKNWLIEKKAIGEQYLIDRKDLENYFLEEIPRTIIINKDFNISALRGPQPSNKETISILDSLLK